MKQIPFRNDRQKSKGNGNGEANFHDRQAMTGKSAKAGGLPYLLVFWSLLAAAAFWSAWRTDFFCLPGLGSQLPFSPAALPGVGSKPGQQCWADEGFFLAGDFRAGDFLVAVGIFVEMRA